MNLLDFDPQQATTIPTQTNNAVYNHTYPTCQSPIDATATPPKKEKQNAKNVLLFDCTTPLKNIPRQQYSPAYLSHK